MPPLLKVFKLHWKHILEVSKKPLQIWWAFSSFREVVTHLVFVLSSKLQRSNLLVLGSIQVALWVSEKHQWQILFKILQNLHKSCKFHKFHLINSLFWVPRTPLHQNCPLSFKKTIFCFGINKLRESSYHTSSTKWLLIHKSHLCSRLKMIEWLTSSLKTMKPRSCKIKHCLDGSSQQFLKLFYHDFCLANMHMRYWTRCISTSTHRWKIECINFAHNWKLARKIPRLSLNMFCELELLHTLFLPLEIQSHKGMILM